MSSILTDRSTVTRNPPVTPEDIRIAGELAHERYTAARRHYTSLYVELSSTESPGNDLTEALEAARHASLALATALRKAEDGDPEAVRKELATGRAPESERARTTDRFSIAELNRAAAATPASWDWNR